MSKLFVDDIREASEGWSKAETVTEAINFIDRFRPEEISLDHDISFPVEVNGLARPYPSKECFCAVARFIVNVRNRSYNPDVILHTANPQGAEDMKAIFKEGGIEAEYKPCPPVNRLEK